MKTDNVTKLALKLAGVYILVQAVLYASPLAQSLQMMDQFPEAKTAVITLSITVGLLLVLGVLLLLKNKPAFEKENSNTSSIMTSALATGGVILMALALADLPILITQLVNNMNVPMGMGSSTQNWMPLAGSLIQIILGGALFLKAKFFGRLVK